MSNTIVLKRGLNVPISGEAQNYLSKTIFPDTVAIRPSDFKGILPRLLVKEGDRVTAGSPVLSDKRNPGIIVSSPASGTVREIVRGEKRKLLAVVIECDSRQEYQEFGKKNPSELDCGQIKDAILKAGLWPWIIQRPYGIIADPEQTPQDIFVSGFNTAPLAGSTDFKYSPEFANIQTGINALAKLTEGSVHFSLCAKCGPGSVLDRISGVQKHYFQGKHPAGNVGVQIAAISPLRKDSLVWTVSLEGLAEIGRLFNTGRYDARRKVAVTGPMAIEASYVKALPGTPMTALKAFYGTNADIIRFVSGDPLSGENVGENGFLGFYADQVTLLKEGSEPELLGWIRPLRYKQFSTDHCYFSWLTPWRKYEMTTNLHGGPRAFVMSDSYYSKVLPMDIYPLYLTKACLAGDIDKMEKFGIYEVVPEDLALCEFVDPSKNNIQDIVAKGIDLMLKEMA